MLRVRRRALAGPRLGPRVLPVADGARLRRDRGGASEALRRAAEELRRSRGTEGEPHAGKRTGVFEITDFYRRFVRYDHVPVEPGRVEGRSRRPIWRRPPTAGCSPIRWASSRRSARGCWPSIRRICGCKKVAARCAAAGQAGQYNYGRCVARGELVAAHCALAGFIEAVISLVYLLNKRYRPFYKWMHRGMKELPILGGECHRLLADLCADCGAAEAGPCGRGPRPAGTARRRDQRPDHRAPPRPRG